MRGTDWGGEAVSESALRRCSWGEAADGQDGDVVFLAEFFGGVGDVEGGLVAEVVDAVEAEEFAGGVTGFDDSVGEEPDAVAGRGRGDGLRSDGRRGGCRNGRLRRNGLC
jgi:hypothetical protein